MTDTTRRDACIICQAPVRTVHAFGAVPLADRLMSAPDDRVDEEDLTLQSCASCGHLQIAEQVAPERLFTDDYPYLSGRIREVVTHFEAYANWAWDSLDLNPGDAVLEIASNDGTLLCRFHERGAKVLGVEPCERPARIAQEDGWPTLHRFFSSALVQEVADTLGGPPRLILANNVIAHVPDPMDVLAGISALCGPDTQVVLEFQYGLRMLQDLTFDLIFHQHYSYFTFSSIETALRRSGLVALDVLHVDTQGGSLRVVAACHGTPARRVEALRQEEEVVLRGLGGLTARFSTSIEQRRTDLLHVIEGVRRRGGRIVGYGAPGKAATLLNHFGLDRSHLDALVDNSPTKQGLFFPRAGIPILSSDHLDQDPPEAILLLAWNYRRSILQELRSLMASSTVVIEYHPHISHRTMGELVDG